MIRVTSLGTVVHGERFVLHVQGKPILVPVGYAIERPVFHEVPSDDRAKRKKPGEVVFTFKAGEGESNETSNAGLTFTAIVREGSIGAGATKAPEYVITRSDDPAHKRYVSDKSISAVWRAAVEEVERDFPAEKDKAICTRDSKGRMQVNGARLFALTYAEVQAEVKGLPGAKEALAAFPPPPSTSAAVPTSLASAPVVNVDMCQGSLSSSGVGGANRTIPSSQKGAATAAAPATRKRGRTAAAAVHQGGGGTEQVEGGGDGAGPDKKRARKLTTARAEAATAAATGGGAPVPPACPDCGLSGTPFCATTGKPHTQGQPPCSVCGLTTAFCPVTGLAHDGTPLRPNRQRGEVHLPGKAAARRRKPSAAAAAALVPTAASAAAAAASGAVDGGAEGVTEVTVVASQDGAAAPKPRAKRARKAGGHNTAEGEVVGPAAATEGDSAAAPPEKKKPRAKRGAGKAAAPAEGATANATDTAPAAPEDEGQTTHDASLVPMPAEPEEPPKPKEFEYPPLRPPLSAAEQHRAANLQAKMWKEAAAQTACPPHVAALHLPFVPYRPPRSALGAAAAAGAATKRKKPGKDENSPDGEASEPLENGQGDADKDAERRDRAGDGNGRAEASEHGDEEAEEWVNNEDSESVSSGRRARKASPLPTIMIHPLEVRDVVTGAAGKRLAKFLQQYTSERTKGELLRAAESERKAAAAAKKAASGKPKKEEGSVVVGGGADKVKALESGEERALLSPEGQEASPTAAAEGLPSSEQTAGDEGTRKVEAEEVKAAAVQQ